MSFATNREKRTDFLLGAVVVAVLCIFAFSGCAGQGSALQNCLDQVATIPAPSSDSAALFRLTAPNSLATGCRFADAARKLQDVDLVRHNATVLAGKLNARGVLSDEQLEQVRKAGKAAGRALDAARDALAAARQAGESGTWFASFVDVQNAVEALVDLVGGVS